MMDAVDLFASVQKITGMGKSTREKHNSLTVCDVWHLWDLLVAKYDTIEVINLLGNSIKDRDLKIVINNILKEIEEGASNVEQFMLEYAIPLPQRPPQTTSSTTNIEMVTDRYIFNRVIELAKQIIPLLATAFSNSTAPIPIKLFKTHLLEMMELVNNLSVYGEAKGYLSPIPMYKA